MDLRALFSREKNWDWGLIFSYDLNPITFFETEILPHIKINKNLTIVIDDSQYKNLISSPDFNPHHLGVFYNLERVRVKRGGIFHAKMYLFLNEVELFLSFGSANMTISGFKQNLESIITLRFNKDNLDIEEINILIQLKDILKNCFTEDNELMEPVSKTLKKTVEDIISSPFMEFIDVIKESRVTSSIENNHHLISSLNLGLLSQIMDLTGHNLDTLQILSPFYDQDLYCFNKVKEVSEKVEIYVPKKDNSFPKDIIVGADEIKNNFSFYTVEKTDNKTDRFIHSKYYRIVKDNLRLDFLTSGNFSKSGLVNDSFPRNFEIGFLYPGEKGDFLENSEVTIEIVEDLEQIIPMVSDNDKDAPKEPSSIFVEAAFYDEAKIYISFNEKYLDNILVSDLEIELFLNDEIAETSNIVERDLEYFVEPSLEIEGDSIIKLRLISKIDSSFMCLPVYVNRIRHNPNYLPVLGASSFNKCVKIGGIDGLERAFGLAKNSGRKDWAVYLLAHWDLDKILAGMRIEGKNDTGDEEGNTEDVTPTLRKSSNKNIKDRIKRNLSCVIGNINLNKKLGNYLDEINKLSININDKIDNYSNFCFPLFLHLSEYFKEILEREEEKKRKNPNIRYPHYTWLHNYNINKSFISIIFEQIKKVMLPSEKGIKKNIDGYFQFLSMAYLWCNIHTEMTREKYSIEHHSIPSFEASLLERLILLSSKVSSLTKEKAKDCYKEYRIDTNTRFLN